MAIWAQIGDNRITTIPPDGRSVVDVYANFNFANESVPEGTIITFLVGKGSAPEGVNSKEALEGAITPIEGVEFVENIAAIESRFIRNPDGSLTSLPVAVVTLKPIADILKDNITIVAYSTYDRLGTAKRLEFGSIDLTVSGSEGSFPAIVERYNPITNVWEEKTGMPTGRVGLSAETVNDKIYAIGGFAGNFLSNVEEYDQSNDSWEVKASMPTARAFAASAVVSNEIYIMGGYIFGPGQSSKTVEKYTPATDEWTTLAEMPFPLAFATSQVIGSDIWLFYGGIQFDEDRVEVYNSGVLRYNVTTDTWTIEDAIISGATTGSISQASSIGDFSVFISGGPSFPSTGFITIDRGLSSQETIRYITYKSGEFLLDSALTFAHSIGATVYNAAMPRKRLTPNSYVDGSIIYIFNGLDAVSRTNNGDVESFSTLTNISVLTSTAAGIERQRAGHARIGSTLYVVGGSSSKSDFLGHVEAVDVPTGVFSGPTGFEKLNTFRINFGCTSANDGINDYIYAVGGQGSGHEKGWLKMEVSVTPEEILADGKETSSITITATDASGDLVPDGVKIRVRGLIYISSTQSKKAIDESELPTVATNEKNPPPSTSILPVHFLAKELEFVNGEASTILLPRSEDFVNEVENLLNFIKANEKVIAQDDLKNKPDDFSNANMKIDERRELYSAAIEVTIEDDAFFGQTDTDATVSGATDPPLASNGFSVTPPSAKQGPSGSVTFSSNVASIPDVQFLTDEPIDANDAIDILDNLREEIPFGASPHFDALVAAAHARIIEPPSLPLLPPRNIIVSASDNENSGSSNNAEQVVEEVNLVDGITRFPVFITTVVVTDPISLAARKARTDVTDLELISSDTGGNSFSLDSEEYVSFIIDRIKTSAPSSMGAGSITATHEVEGSISSFGFVVSNMIEDNEAILTARYSNDGYTFIDFEFELSAANGTGDIIANFTLGEPVQARIVEYTVKLSSKTFDSPILKSVTIKYIRPNVQYLFTNPQTVSGQVTELAAVTNERLPSGSTVEVGFVHGSSLEFERDFVTITQPGIIERGTITAITRDAPLLGDKIFRDIMESEDFLIYKSKSGPWVQDAITKVFLNEQEVLPSDFISVPEEGMVVFKKKLSSIDVVGIEIQNPSVFTVGLKITNPTLDSGVLDSFAFTYGESQVAAGLRPNRPPLASNLFITPSPIFPGGPIEANYTFIDPDNDEEDKDQTEIIWFRNNVPVPELKNKRSFTNRDLVAKRLDNSSDNLITRGQEWFFSVRPSDGRSFGPLAVSHTVIISNVPPVATSAKLISSNTDPLKFTSTDIITAEFKFSDNDEDEGVSTVYVFLVNGIEIKTGNENTLSPEEEDDAGNKFIRAGAQIFARITPFDGTDFGDPVETETITVQSSPPTVADVSVLPTKPSAVSSLTLSYRFVDADKDADQSRIAWFANDVRKTNFDNLKTVSRGTLKPGQQWYAIVTPHDGETEGTPVKSNVIIVQN